MRDINHALTGALIGLTITRPVVAVPLAVVSHFICDALPHYDSELASVSASRWVVSNKFRTLLLADALLCVGLVVLLAVKQPAHWWLAAICAFAATSPDLLWINQFIHARQKRFWRPNAFSSFAVAIQWFHKPIGAVVEIAWFASAVVLLVPFLR